MEHVGDNYFDAADYRRRFADGRVGSHSALARPEQGQAIIAAAVEDISADYQSFTSL